MLVCSLQHLIRTIHLPYHTHVHTYTRTHTHTELTTKLRHSDPFITLQWGWRLAVIRPGWGELVCLGMETQRQMGMKHTQRFFFYMLAVD